jgi:hypothetical protein
MIRIVESNFAQERVEAAADFVKSLAPSTEILLLGESRDGIDDFVYVLVFGLWVNRKCRILVIVLEFRLQTLAGLDPVFVSDRHVTAVEQPVEFA